jgi:hypothetical protein
VCDAALVAADAAELLLDKHNFIGHGDYLKSKGKKHSDYSYALELAEILDEYNNGLLCGGDAPPPPPPPPPPEPPPEGTVHVEAMVGSAKGNRQAWSATVEIQVHNQDGQPVLGATVTGDWSGAASGADSCTTDDSGWCKVSATKLSPDAADPATFAVTNIEGGEGYSYDDSANLMTSIDVPKPY